MPFCTVGTAVLLACSLAPRPPRLPDPLGRDRGRTGLLRTHQHLGMAAMLTRLLHNRPKSADLDSTLTELRNR